MQTDELTLLTDRLSLRRSRPEDAEAIAAYRNDPEVRRFQGWDLTDLDAVRESVREMAGRTPGKMDWVQFSVIERSTGRLVGDVGLCPSGDPGVIKVGYTIAPSHQGQGYATEAVAALIDYIFEELGALTVRAYADADNLASRRVAEHVGMRLMETFEEVEDGQTWFGVRYERDRGPAGSA